jgi:hypothetical protein
MPSELSPQALARWLQSQGAVGPLMLLMIIAVVVGPIPTLPVSATAGLMDLPLHHSRLTFGYAIAHRDGARFAYLTDTIGLPQELDAFLREWVANQIAVDSSHPPSDSAGKAPQNHNDVTTALEIIPRSGAHRGWLMDNPGALPPVGHSGNGRAGRRSGQQ